MITFGSKLKEARKIKQLTQKQLAEKIGAKHNSVSDWENDKNKPDPDTIELICGVLDISASYLLGTKDPANLLSPEALEVAQLYDEAELDKQNIVRLTLGLDLKKESKITRIYENLVNAPYKIAEKSTEYSNKDHLILNAAHKLPNATEEDIQHDEDIMDDPEF